MSEHLSTTDPLRPAAGPSKTSAMAVIALVLALLPMCVPLNLVGSFLGVIALRRVNAAGGLLRGRMAAHVAIWGGLILTVSGWWAWTALGQWGERAIQQTAAETTTAFLRDAAEGRPQDALGHWSPSAPRPSEAEVEAFGQVVAAIGEVKSVGIVSMQPLPGGSMLQPTWSAWLVITIDTAQYDGSARFDLLPGVGSLSPRAVLRQVLIDGPEGDVSLPVAAVEPAP